jgi:hypothetical protein
MHPVLSALTKTWATAGHNVSRRVYPLAGGHRLFKYTIIDIKSKGVPSNFTHCRLEPFPGLYAVEQLEEQYPKEHLVVIRVPTINNIPDEILAHPV